MKTREILIFFQGLQRLLAVGLNLMTALELQLKVHPRQTWALEQLIASLRKGQSFSRGLDLYLSLPHFISVYIRLGETQGNLARACGLCVDGLMRQQTWKRMLWEISFYPILLILTSVALLILMLGFVLPEFASLYRALNVALPASTAWLLAVAQFAPQIIPWFVSGIIFILLIFWISWRQARGRFQIEVWMQHIPVLNTLLIHHYEYQFALSLGILLQGGCSLLDALDFMRLSANSPLYQQYLKIAQQCIREGKGLKQSFCQGLLQSPALSALLGHAEQTGQLDQILLNLANQHIETFQYWQNRGKHLIQPFITLLLGGFLGFWILLLYYPMLQLGTNLG